VTRGRLPRRAGISLNGGGAAAAVPLQTGLPRWWTWNAVGVGAQPLEQLFGFIAVLAILLTERYILTQRIDAVNLIERHSLQTKQAEFLTSYIPTTIKMATELFRNSLNGFGEKSTFYRLVFQTPGRIFA